MLTHCAFSGFRWQSVNAKTIPGKYQRKRVIGYPFVLCKGRGGWMKKLIFDLRLLLGHYLLQSRTQRRGSIINMRGNTMKPADRFLRTILAGCLEEEHGEPSSEK
jgi:hypothetical protein